MKTIHEHSIYKRLAAVICILTSMFLVSCGAVDKTQTTSQISDQNLYAGEIQEADVFIDIPNLRQYGGYTCGTTCVQMLMNWMFPYQGDLNLATYEEELGTSEEAGTPPENIVTYFKENKIQIHEKEKRTINDLIFVLDQGHPILMCIQAWTSSEDGYNTTDSEDSETYLTEGHWVICIGYQKQKSGYVFYFNDPACVGHCIMDEDDLDQRWIDMDTNGKVYDHYGIEIAETGDSYNPNGVFYLE